MAVTNSVTNIAGVIDPTFKCFVDESPIAGAPYSSDVANQRIVCSAQNLVDGQHTFKVDTSTTEQPFFFDYLAYRPSTGASLDNEAVVFDSTDPTFNFTPATAWKPSNYFNATTTNGSIVSLEFNGTCIVLLAPFGLILVLFMQAAMLYWYGTIPGGGDTPDGSSNCAYTIDGGKSTPFVLTAQRPGTLRSSAQLLFQTPKLDPKHHTISVTYLGGPNTVPLSVEYIIVSNSSSTSFLTPSSTISSTASVTPSSVPKPSLNIGAVIGGVLGGLALLTLILSTLLLFRYRARKRAVAVDRVAPTPFNQREMVESPEPHVPFDNVIPRHVSPKGSTPMQAISQIGGRSQASTSGVDSSSQVGSSSSNWRAVRHEDSGVRFFSSPNSVIDLPPSYTSVAGGFTAF